MSTNDDQIEAQNATQNATDTATQTATQGATQTDKKARTATGRVLSNKMEQSATVLVERKVKHPVYGKYVRRSKKIHIHDSENVLNIGDIVQIKECRPISKTKSWTLDKVIEATTEQ